MQLCGTLPAAGLSAAPPRARWRCDRKRTSTGSTPTSRPDDARETASPIGNFIRDDAVGGHSAQVTLAIDTRDCIGCEVCVAHCDKGVLRMIDGKALIDLRHLNSCDLDGECVEVCPTNVVSLSVVELTPAARGPRDHDEAA